MKICGLCGDEITDGQSRVTFLIPNEETRVIKIHRTCRDSLKSQICNNESIKQELWDELKAAALYMNDGSGRAVYVSHIPDILNKVMK